MENRHFSVKRIVIAIMVVFLIGVLTKEVGDIFKEWGWWRSFFAYYMSLISILAISGAGFALWLLWCAFFDGLKDYFYPEE